MIVGLLLPVVVRKVALLSLGLCLVGGVNAAGTDTAGTDAELEAVRELAGAGQFAEADARVRELLAKVDVPGADNGTLATVIEATVGLALRMNREDALSLAQRLVQLRDDADIPGPLAVALSHLGQVHHRRGELAEALVLLDRAVQIHEAAGSPSVDLATSLRMLANLHVDLGQADDAEREFERVLEMDSGSNAMTVAATFYSLGRLHDGRERYDDARAAYRSGLDALGDMDHLLVAYLRNAIAIILWEQDDYGAAREHFERAVQVSEAHFGAGHPFVRSCRQNLALVSLKVGDFKNAEAALLDELGRHRESPDQDREEMAKALFALAEAQVGLGNLRDATAALEEALEIREELFGPDHGLTAGTLWRLGVVDLEAGRVESGLARLEQFLDRQRQLGPRAVLTGEGLTDLGRARTAAGDLDGARGALEEALSILEETVGHGNPRVALAMERLAEVELRAGKYEQAAQWAMRAERIGQEHAALTVSCLAEREALLHADVRTDGLDIALSVLTRGPGGSLATDVWNAIVRSRALVLQEMTHRRATLGDSADTDSLGGQYRKASRTLARLLVAGPEDGSAADFERRLREARQERDRVERRLARASQLGAQSPEDRSGLGDQIRAALPVNSALVSFVRFENRQEGGALDSYGAWVIRSDQEPKFVSLGAERDLQSAFDRWRGEVSEGPFRTNDEQAALVTYREAGDALRRIVWDPLAPWVGSADLVFIVPDGLVHLVTFGTLPDEDGRFLVEQDRRFHYLSAERNVRRVWPDIPSVGLLAVGDVDYGPLGSHRLRRFEPLPETGVEAETVRDFFREHDAGGESAQLLTGDSATEEAVSSLAPGRAVLHFATHGIFTEADRRDAPTRRSRGIGGLSLDSPRPVRRSNVSGLVLAHANLEGRESDGILTAEEISALDLSGTRWSVLSACDTGVGPIHSAEGVLGLRRAFEVAGVHTLILSLWGVDDEGTRQWMTRLYEARWVHAMNTADSIRHACIQTLDERRKNGDSDHPFYWGAFVAAGDWN